MTKVLFLSLSVISTHWEMEKECVPVLTWSVQIEFLQWHRISYFFAEDVGSVRVHCVLLVSLDVPRYCANVVHARNFIMSIQ